MTAGRVTAEELGRSQRVAFSIVLHSRGMTQESAMPSDSLSTHYATQIGLAETGGGAFAAIRILAQRLKRN